MSTECDKNFKGNVINNLISEDIIDPENDQDEFYYINRIKRTIIIFSTIIFLYFIVCIKSYFTHNLVLFSISIFVLFSVISILIYLFIIIRKLIKKQIDTAKKNNAVKDEFLASMSHEIRTPLNGISGMLYLLRDTGLTQEQNRYLDTIFESSDHLLSLINDILDISKIEAGKLEIDNRAFNLELLVKGLYSIFEIQAEKKGIEFSSSIGDNVPSNLFGDPGRIRQILTNLIGNAIKFTEIGRVSLKVSSVVNENGSCELLFTIEDTGPGIPEDKKDKIFEAFTQADSSISKSYGGTGLGLKITKQLAEILGGSVGVESEEFIGSNFWAKIPLKINSDVKTKRKKSADECKSILIIGKNQTSNTKIAKKINKLGISTQSTTNIEEIIRILGKNNEIDRPVQVLIIIVSHEGPDPEKIFKLISEKPELNNIKMILVTSIGKKGDAHYYESIGFEAYLSCPVDSDLISDCIQEIFSRTSPGENIITRHSIMESKAAVSKVLLVEDNSTNRIVAKGLLKRIGIHPDIAKDGFEALELFEKKKYDLILLDCQMPKMNGFEVTEKIRGSEKNNKSFIIAMTADAFAGNKKKCIESGMNDFIKKPIDPDVLYETLSKYITIKNFSEEKEHLNIESETKIDAENKPVFKYKKMLEIYNDETELVKEILEDFLCETPEIIERMKHFSKTDMMKDVKLDAHSLKGSSANISAERFRHQAITIEKLADAKPYDKSKIIASVEKLEGCFLELKDKIEKNIYN